MRPIEPGTDRWQADVQLPAEGDWRFRVRAWVDDWHTWLHNAEIKVPAGQDVELMFRMGVDLLTNDGGEKIVLDAIRTFDNLNLSPAARLKAARDPRLAAVLDEDPLRSLATLSEELTIRVERTRAGVGSWYEFFPRSEGARKQH